MKKFFISILSVLLVFAVCILGTGCGDAVLTFNNNFGGTDQAPTSLKEVLKYNVDYVENFNDGYIKKSDNLTDQIIDLDYSGTMVEEFEIISILPTHVQNKTDIDVSSSRIYRLTYKTEIIASFKINGQTDVTTVTDYVNQEVYFLPAGLSFAPIYSSVDQVNTAVVFDKDNAKVSLTRSRYQVAISYDRDTYTVDKLITPDLANPDAVTHSNDQYDYDYREVIDNNQLFFAIRNSSLSQGASRIIPVVSLSYGYAVDIYLGNEKEETLENLSINYNGQALTEDVQVQDIRYIVNATKNAGSSQFVYVQKVGSETLPYRALPVQIVETLTTYGAFESLGALVYTLTDVEIK